MVCLKKCQRKKRQYENCQCKKHDIRTLSLNPFHKNTFIKLLSLELISKLYQTSLKIEVTKSYILFFLQSFFYNQGANL